MQKQILKQNNKIMFAFLKRQVHSLTKTKNKIMIVRKVHSLTKKIMIARKVHSLTKTKVMIARKVHSWTPPQKKRTVMTARKAHSLTKNKSKTNTKKS